MVIGVECGNMALRFAACKLCVRSVRIARSPNIVGGCTLAIATFLVRQYVVTLLHLVLTSSDPIMMSEEPYKAGS